MKRKKSTPLSSIMGIVGGIIIVVFGVYWISLIIEIDISNLFAILGLFFIIIGVVNIVFHYRNLTGKIKMLSYDIRDEVTEQNPEDGDIGYNKTEIDNPDNIYDVDKTYKYCPHCGESLKKNYGGIK